MGYVHVVFWFRWSFSYN